MPTSDSEVENLLTKGAIAEIPPPPHKRRFLQSFVPCPQEGWNFLTCDRLEFSEQVRGKLSLPGGKHSLFKVSTSNRRLYDHPGSERRLFVSPGAQGLSKVPSIPLEKQMLRLPKPLFWLKYCTKDLHQTFKTHSSISSQTGCSYDPLSGRLSNLGVNLPEGTESHSYGCIPPRKPRLHCQPGKVMFDSDANNNIPGLCNRLHCRSTKPPTGESYKGEIPLLESKGNSNYACSSNSECTRHSRLVSLHSSNQLSNLASSGKRSDPTNYRPISVIPKVFERIIYDQLYHYLTKNNFLSCHQSGFRSLQLHFRHLQIRMIQALHSSNQNFDVTITLDHDSLEELHWWVSNINSVNGSPIRPPAPTLFITTDACKTGWGAVCESQRTNGRWSDSEGTQHINVLELKAAFLALKAFLKNQSHKVVYLRMDKTTAVAHVNNKGGTHSPCLLTLTLELWHWCLERNIMISAQHVPGKLNTIADSESRVFNDSSKWKIDPQSISPFLKGCKIDLFASRLPTQLPQHVSWRPDPEAVHADALTMDWAPFKGYAFPPFNLIPAVLNKVSQDKADIILVAPIWPAQSWPLLLSLLIEHPVLLPSSRHLVRDPADPQRVHPMFPRLHLAVFHVSGDSTRQWEFQTMLQRFSFQHPTNLQGKHINQLGDAGVAGVLRERLILFQRP